MAVLTKEALLAKINGHLGDDASDEALSLVEDITDTLDSLESGSSDENWKQKYEDNDAAWRKKYRDRFFSGKSDPDDDDDNNPDDNKPKTFSDLFKEG